MSRLMFDDVMLARLFLLTLVLAGLSRVWFDRTAGSMRLLPCPIHAITSVPCPGCGMTRSCLALSRSEFKAAWDYHPFSFVLVGLAAAVGIAPRRTQRVWSRMSPRWRHGVVAVALVLLVCRWSMQLWLHVEWGVP